MFECRGACEPAVWWASKLPTPWGFNALGVIIYDKEGWRWSQLSFEVPLGGADFPLFVVNATSPGLHSSHPWGGRQMKTYITTLHYWCCNLIYTFQLYSTTTFEIAQDFLRTGLEVWGECDNGWRWRVAWSGLMEVMTRSLVLGPHVMQKPPWPWPRQVLGQPLTSILCWWSGVSVAICSYTTRPPCVLRTAARSKMISGAARNKLLVQTKYPFTLMVMTSNMVGEGDDLHGRVCR